jgi:hypothetical protein
MALILNKLYGPTAQPTTHNPNHFWIKLFSHDVLRVLTFLFHTTLNEVKGRREKSHTAVNELMGVRTSGRVGTYETANNKKAAIAR